MLFAAAPSLTLLLIDLAFAAIMLAAGLAAGWWLFGRATRFAMDANRSLAAAAKIRELAQSVAADVGAHNTRVQAISSELNDHAAAGDADLDQIILNTVAEMVQANESLQSQLATAQERLDQQAQEIEARATDARTDALTGLTNRRGFDDELGRRLAEWKRSQIPHSLLIVDVDHFKTFNDVHGHLAGDEVLRGVGQVLKAATREMDEVCRYGGEEFAVIMPNTKLYVAKPAAERARAAIETAKFRFQGKDLKVTASIGLAEIRAGEDGETLVKRADQALYASKEVGRNAAHYHDGETPRRIRVERPSKEQAASQPAISNEPEQRRTPALDALPKRTFFISELGRRIAEGQRYEVPLSTMLIEVHRYKAIAAQYGNHAGDLVLDTIVQHLQVLLREMDLLARYERGRFVVMLPGTTSAAAAGIARRIREEISDCAVPLGDSTLTLSVLIGLAEMQRGDDNEALLARTLAALVEASANDKPCVDDATGRDEEETVAVGT